MTASTDAAIPARRHRQVTMKASSRRLTTVLFVVMSIISVLLLAPVVWLVLASLKTPGEVSTWPITWLPTQAQWSNYAEALTEMAYLPMMMNSIFLATVFGLLSTFTSALCGYGFARLQARGKNIAFGILIAMMMTPPIITLIPTYLMFARVNLVGTYWPWVLWGLCGSTGVIFLFRQQFSTLPRELGEAALIDGAGQFRIFAQIFLPLTKPLLVTSFVFAFTGVWGDFITPSLLLSMDNTTLAVGLAQGYPNPGGQPRFHLTAAGSVMYVIPAVLLFLSVQRIYVRGVTSSAVKG